MKNTSSSSPPCPHTCVDEPRTDRSSPISATQRPSGQRSAERISVARRLTCGRVTQRGPPADIAPELRVGTAASPVTACRYVLRHPSARLTGPTASCRLAAIATAAVVCRARAAAAGHAGWRRGSTSGPAPASSARVGRACGGRYAAASCRGGVGLLVRAGHSLRSGAAAGRGPGTVLTLPPACTLSGCAAAGRSGAFASRCRPRPCSRPAACSALRTPSAAPPVGERHCGDFPSSVRGHAPSRSRGRRIRFRSCPFGRLPATVHSRSRAPSSTATPITPASPPPARLVVPSASSRASPLLPSAPATGPAAPEPPSFL